MSPASLARSRVFTSSGTVLFVDPATSELRHGPIEQSPENVFLVSLGGEVGSNGLASLVGSENQQRPIVCKTTQSRVVEDKPDSAEGSVLEVVYLERGLVGLKSQDLFLCAEPDGRITLSRRVCSDWEFFLLSEDWPAAEGRNGHRSDKNTLPQSTGSGSRPSLSIRACGRRQNKIRRPRSY